MNKLFKHTVNFLMLSLLLSILAIPAATISWNNVVATNQTSKNTEDVLPAQTKRNEYPVLTKETSETTQTSDTDYQ